MKTAKELRAEAHVKMTEVNNEAYIFMPEQLDAFVDQVCREQAEICANACDDDYYWDRIRNAPQPETK